MAKTFGLARKASVPRGRQSASRMRVYAKVDLDGGPRIVRGKCFVTRDVSSANLSLLTFGFWFCFCF